MSQSELELAEFADNPEPRCAVVLLLDTSGSMHGQPISELNAGLKEFERALKSDRLASLRVEVAVVTFGGSVKVLGSGSEGSHETTFDPERAFITADAFSAPLVHAGGDTPMGEAARRAISLLRERKDIYKRNGIDYFRPWIFLITDGNPTDNNWELAAEQARQEEERKGVLIYTVGVEKADMKTLEQFSSKNQPVKLKGLAFRELFQWLSKSLSAVAQSRPGEQVALPPVGWATVDTSH